MDQEYLKLLQAIEFFFFKNRENDQALRVPNLKLNNHKNVSFNNDLKGIVEKI